MRWFYFLDSNIPHNDNEKKKTKKNQKTKKNKKTNKKEKKERQMNFSLVSLE